MQSDFLWHITNYTGNKKEIKLIIFFDSLVLGLMCKAQYLALFSQSKNDFFKEEHLNLILRHREALAKNSRKILTHNLTKGENPASMN